MNEQQRNEAPADLVALNVRTREILALVKVDDAKFGLEALISAYATLAYRSDLHLRAASTLHRLASNLEAYGTGEDLHQVASQHRGRIPVPTKMPEQLPEGYTIGATGQISELCVKLAMLLDGYPNHVGLSALVSIYGTVASCTGDLVKAGEFLVKVGTDMVAEAKTPADCIPAPASAAMH